MRGSHRVSAASALQSDPRRGVAAPGREGSRKWPLPDRPSPSSEYSGLISFRVDCFDLLAVQGTLKSVLKSPQFRSINSSVLSLLYGPTLTSMGFPGGSDGKESVCNAGDLGSIPGLGRSPGEVNGNPFQYSYLENSMERRAWGATVHGVTHVAE